MNDITLLAHQEPVFGAAPSDTTVRRTLELADPATLDKIARARAAVRLMAARRIPHSGLRPGPKFPRSECLIVVAGSHLGACRRP